MYTYTISALLLYDGGVVMMEEGERIIRCAASWVRLASVKVVGGSQAASAAAAAGPSPVGDAVVRLLAWLCDRHGLMAYCFSFFFFFLLCRGRESLLTSKSNIIPAMRDEFGHFRVHCSDASCCCKEYVGTSLTERLCSNCNHDAGVHVRQSKSVL